MISTYASYKMASSDMTRTLQRVEEQPVVSREVEYYKENISNVKTIDDLLNDYRLFSFAMKAHGLSDMTYAKAFMRKVLDEGIDDRTSFANSLSDQKYKAFAETFNFKNFGENTTTFTKVQTGVVDKYLRQTVEEQAGEENEGVRLALYFQRKTADLKTDTEGSDVGYYQLLADKALGVVVRTALGLPDEIAAADVDKQVELIKKKLDISDLKDPEKLEKFLARFTSLWELNNSEQLSSAATNAGLLFGQGASSGIGVDLMLQISQLKR